MDQIDEVDVAQALALLDDSALLLDVREHDEWLAGHVERARHIPLATLPDFVDDLPREGVIVCVCRAGGRSARAAQFLLEQGFNVANLRGGMTAWHEAGAQMVADGSEPTVI